MKILVTDDSKMARRMVIKSLRKYISHENEIIQASNGQECLDHYQTHQPDLVFLDLTMPIMDGFTALEKLKEFDQNAKVIVVSADIQKGSMEKVRASGAINFIKKPIDDEKMQQIIERYLKVS